MEFSSISKYYKISRKLKRILNWWFEKIVENLVIDDSRTKKIYLISKKYLATDTKNGLFLEMVIARIFLLNKSVVKYGLIQMVHNFGSDDFY